MLLIERLQHSKGQMSERALEKGGRSGKLSLQLGESRTDELFPLPMERHERVSEKDALRLARLSLSPLCETDTRVRVTGIRHNTMLRLM
jgi:hypothetical protein